MSYNVQYNCIPLNSQLVTDSPKMMLIRKLIVFIVLWLKETSPFVHVAACTLQWRHNERHGISNHRHFDCILNRLFRRRSVTPKMFPFDDVTRRSLNDDSFTSFVYLVSKCQIQDVYF